MARVRAIRLKSLMGAALAGLLAAVSTAWAQGTPAWHATPTPLVADGLPATWIEIDAPNGHKLSAAVFRPDGKGPFPVVILLHASGGFGLVSIRLGEEFSRAGFLTVAACWFTGSSPYDPPLNPLVACPQGPPFAGATLASLPYIDAIVRAARALPGAIAGKIGLIGQSRGANIAVLYASNGGTVQAVVVDSAAFTVRRATDTAAIDYVHQMTAPLLILHGTDDQVVPVADPREYQSALERLGKVCEAQYYEHSEHVLTRKNNQYYGDAVQRSVLFFRQYLTR